MRSHFSFATMLFTCLVLFSNLTAAGQTYLQVPNDNTLPDAINDRGVVVGHLGDERGGKRGFIRQRSGQITIFKIPSQNPCSDILGGSTWPKGINNKGEIVGTIDCFETPSPEFAPGFLREPNGHIVYLKDPHGNPATAHAINDFGFIVGIIKRPSGRIVGFVRNRKGDYAYLPHPPHVEIWPFGINDAGTVVGSYRVFDPVTRVEVLRRGFLYRHGSYHFFDLGDFRAISNTGDALAGEWVRRRNGSLVPLQNVLSTLPSRTFTGLNARHALVGYYGSTFAIEITGFLLKHAY